MYSTDLFRRLGSALDRDPRPRPDPGDRLAGVLVPVVEGRSVVFTKRSDALPRHPGEISFPGGIHQDGDATVAETALRLFPQSKGDAP